MSISTHRGGANERGAKEAAPRSEGLPPEDRVERLRLHRQAYRLANREHIAAYNKAWKLAHPAKVFEMGRAWSVANVGRRRVSTASWRRRLRSLGRAYIDSLKAGGCVDCGNKNLSVLDFDHTRDKVVQLSHMWHRPFAEIDAEAAKCEVRCANCHRIKTIERRTA